MANDTNNDLMAAYNELMERAHVASPLAALELYDISADLLRRVRS